MHVYEQYFIWLKRLLSGDLGMTFSQHQSVASVIAEQIRATLLLTLAALFPAWFTHYDPLAISPRDAFQEPNAQHWFGTDPSGRGLFSRVIYGASMQTGST